MEAGCGPAQRIGGFVLNREQQVTLLGRGAAPGLATANSRRPKASCPIRSPMGRSSARATRSAPLTSSRQTSCAENVCPEAPKQPERGEPPAVQGGVVDLQAPLEDRAGQSSRSSECRSG